MSNNITTLVAIFWEQIKPLTCIQTYIDIYTYTYIK